MTFEEVDGIVRSPEPRQRPAQRLRGFLSSTGIWQRAVWAHVALYRLSRGWCGGTIGGVPHLLLTTTGRRSNQPRTVPLAYVRDGPRFVVVATNGGADNDPAWLLNLRSTRTATIQIGGTRTSVVAHVATKRELMSGWPRRVQVRSARGLALVVLEPLSTD